MDVEIPANTTATVFVPATKADDVTESGRKLPEVNTVKLKDEEDGYVVLELGSGVYHFEVHK